MSYLGRPPCYGLLQGQSWGCLRGRSRRIDRGAVRRPPQRRQRERSTEAL